MPSQCHPPEFADLAVFKKGFGEDLQKGSASFLSQALKTLGRGEVSCHFQPLCSVFVESSPKVITLITFMRMHHIFVCMAQTAPQPQVTFPVTSEVTLFFKWNRYLLTLGYVVTPVTSVWREMQIKVKAIYTK